MAKEAGKKTKRPTAAKREIQNEKKYLRNRMFKSRVRTALRNFESAVAQGDSAETSQKLCQVYSLMDKGVKKGIFKRNKADRTKARLTKRAAVA